MAINNQYEGKEPEQVWQEMANEQRAHFIEDHKWEFDLSVRNYGEWDTLTNQQRDSITRHVHNGQYAKGGITPKMHDKVKFNAGSDGILEGEVWGGYKIDNLKVYTIQTNPNIKFTDKDADDRGSFYDVTQNDIIEKTGSSKRTAKACGGMAVPLVMLKKGGTLGIDRKVKFRRSESNPNKWVFTITYADLIDGEKVWREYSNYVSDAYTTKKEAIKESEEVLRREDERNKKMAHGGITLRSNVKEGIIKTIGNFLTEKTSLKQIFNH